MPQHIPNPDVISFHSIPMKVEDLFSHLIVTGQPGSGKSRCVTRVLARELLKLRADDPERKTGLFCIDGKGGELRQSLEEALDLAGRRDDLILVGPKAATFNPFSDPGWSEIKVAAAITEAINTTGNESIRRSLDPFWDNANRDVLSALVAVARNVLQREGKPTQKLNASHLAKLRPFLSKSDSEIARIAADLAIVIGEEAGASLVEFAALAPTTRHSVATGVGTILGPFGRSPLKDVLVPTRGRPEADLTTIINEGKVILFDVADSENASELLPAMILAKACFARMILSRRRCDDMNQVRPVFAFLEEFQRVMTPQPDSPACEGNWMDACRWAGCGAVLATQGISSLLAKASPALVDKIISLCSTQVWLASSDPASASYAARSLPQKLTHQVHRTVSFSPPPPLLFPRDQELQQQTETALLVPVREPVLLDQLTPGTMHLRLRDGCVHLIKADLAAS